MGLNLIDPVTQQEENRPSVGVHANPEVCRDRERQRLEPGVTH